MGEGDVGEREIIYLSLHCHHQNDSCILMGSDESQFNASLTARDKDTRQCPQTTTLEEKGDPKRIRTEVLLLQYQPNVLPLGQNGSLSHTHTHTHTHTKAMLGAWTYICCVFPAKCRLQRFTNNKATTTHVVRCLFPSTVTSTLSDTRGYLFIVTNTTVPSGRPAVAKMLFDACGSVVCAI